MIGSFAQRQGDRGRAAHAHRLILNGAPGSFQLPPLCPNCGAAASETIALHKVFDVSASDDPARYVTTTLKLPVCAACGARHRAKAVEPTLLRRIATTFETFDMVGALALTVGAAFIAGLALERLLGGDLLSAALLLLPALMMLSARAQYRKATADTAYRRIPAASDVVRAFDYSDNIAGGFEQPRFLVTIKDAGFAEAFERLNAARLYRVGSVEALADSRTARRKAGWWMAALIVLLLLAMLFGD